MLREIGDELAKPGCRNVLKCHGGVQMALSLPR
jgi:hypothetical protein